jgi:four helix bundle protein
MPDGAQSAPPLRGVTLSAPTRGMTNQRTPPQLPHHRLVAYHVAVDLLLAVRAANIRDAKLRDEALRAAKSAVLNIAEGAGRVSRPDKSRAFTIARGEGLEAFAALETAALVGDAEAADVERCLPVAQRLYALLTGLLR